MLIMAIILGIVAPAVAGQVNRANTNRAAREAISLLRRVRADAVNHYEPRYVKVETSVDPDEFRVFAYRSGDWGQIETLVVAKGVTASIPSASDFPELANTPETGKTVPSGAAYFSTRGGYPYDTADPTPGNYTIRVKGRFTYFRDITVAVATGMVNPK